MATLAELQAREAALEAALASGTEYVSYDGKAVRYRAQSDIKAALAEVRREMRGARPGALVLYDEQGLRPLDRRRRHRAIGRRCRGRVVDPAGGGALLLRHRVGAGVVPAVRPGAFLAAA